MLQEVYVMYLMNTCALLWFLDNNGQLSEKHILADEYGMEMNAELEGGFGLCVIGRKV